MQTGQVIWFEWQGQKLYGITETVLPDKAGVVAIVRVNGTNVQVKVQAPHKVRDITEANEVRKQFGLPAINVPVQKTPAPTPIPVASAPIVEPSPVDPETMFNEQDIAWLKQIHKIHAFIIPNSVAPKTDDEPKKA